MAGNARSLRALLGVFAIVLVACVAAPASASAFECGPVVDDFDRADSTDLGPDWVEPNDPGLAISSNRLTNPTTQYGFATHTTATGNSACADISVNPAVSSQYAGIGLRTTSPGSVLWVKVQDNDTDSGATFNEIFFRIGHQGAPPNGTFSPQVTVPSFTSGRLHVRAVGDTFTVEVNTDGDPESEIDITRDIVPSGMFTAPNGTGVSVGAYNGSTLDNFSVLADTDWDGALDGSDNCPDVANPSQADTDSDSVGDTCDPTPTGDTDADGVDNAVDNCPTTANPGQQNADADALGDACDPTPNGDTDGDGVDEFADNCPLSANADQANLDGDALGDACDPDDDGDTVADGSDRCPVAKATVDLNGDGCTDPDAKVTTSPVFRGLGKGKKGNRAKKRYFFTFQTTMPGATFRCSLDAAPFAPCSSPAVYTGLRPGSHAFAVKSVDANGVESPPQSTSFRIKKPRTR
jgi:hypothetical protein